MNIVTMLPAMVWLILSASFFAFGEFLSKKFVLAPSVPYVIIILFVYSLGTLTFLCALLQKNQLSVVGAIWSVLSLLATVLIGVLIFNEKLNPLSIAGLIFGAVAITLLSLA